MVRKDMQKKIIKKELAYTIIILFVGASIFPSINGNITENHIFNRLETRVPHAVIDEAANPSIDTDWWPMFHHDILNTGFSTSEAPDTNETKWIYTASSSIFSSPAVVDGRVFVGSNGGEVYCLDADTGDKIWDYPAGSGVVSSPAISDGRVYVGCDNGKVYCLNADTGNKIWDYPTGDHVISSPAVFDGKILVGSYDNNMYCLDANNGSKIWDYLTGDYILSSPAVAEGKVYFGSYDHYMYCLNIDNGSEIWRHNLGNWIRSSPAFFNGNIYVASFNRNLYCLNGENGSTIWASSIGGATDCSPAIAYGKVYICSDDDHLYCFDAYSGGEIWRYSIAEHPQWSSPAVADGKVYVGAGHYENKIYCINANNGTEIWNYTADDVVWSSPAIADGRVFVGSHDDNIYCFEDPNTPPYAPTIDGETQGHYGESYEYIFVSTDPDGDDVRYYIDWYDDQVEEWIGPYESGEEVIVSHTWEKRGIYTIKAKAKDEFDAESDWAYLEIKMPVNQQSAHPWFTWFLERFPNAFPILRNLIGI